MDKVIELAKELREAIEDSDEYKAYIINKNLYENSQDLIELKKLVVRARRENRIEDYNVLKKQYDNQPLVVNFLESKRQFKELLETIKNMIN